MAYAFNDDKSKNDLSDIVREKLRTIRGSLPNGQLNSLNASIDVPYTTHVPFGEMFVDSYTWKDSTDAILGTGQFYISDGQTHDIVSGDEILEFALSNNHMLIKPKSGSLGANMPWTITYHVEYKSIADKVIRDSDLTSFLYHDIWRIFGIEVCDLKDDVVLSANSITTVQLKGGSDNNWMLIGLISVNIPDYILSNENLDIVGAGILFGSDSSSNHNAHIDIRNKSASDVTISKVVPVSINGLYVRNYDV